MKKKLLILLGTLYTLALVAVAAVVIYFWSYISAIDWSIVNSSNIRALYQGLTESPEVTMEKKKQLDSERSEEIRNYVNMELRDFTDEEKQQIDSGEKTQTQILAQIITETVEGKTQQEEKPQSEEKPDTDTDNTTSEKPDAVKTEKPQVKDEKPKDTVKPQEKPKPQGETAEQIVARHVSKLYAIQGEFEGRVASLAGSASNWVKAYKKANPGITWRDAKVAGVQHFSGTASQIENECYARVDAQISKLVAELKAIGADTSIASTIKSTAYAEMDARKAQIVQQGYAKLNG